MLGKFSGGSVTCIKAKIKQREREAMRFRAASGDRVGFASRFSWAYKEAKQG